MNTTGAKVIGSLLVLAGTLVAVFSERIVFPGLERLVGIETIVGHDNIVYQPGGGYYFTNPTAMIRWVLSVRAFGIVICLFGGWLLLRRRKIRPKISEESVNKTASS